MNYCLVKGLISLASPEQAAILWGESSVVALALLLAEALRFPATERCAVGQSRPKKNKTKPNDRSQTSVMRLRSDADTQ